MTPLAPRTPTRVLRGRAREQAILHGALADPVVRLVVVSGPAGAGKSTLAATAAAAEPALVGAAAFPLEAGSGAGPVVAAVESALNEALEGLFDPDAVMESLVESLGDTADAFTGFGSPVLAQLAQPSGQDRHNVGVAAAAERLGEALAEVCNWLVQLRGPLILLLDDWGRGGPEAWRVVDRLVQATPELKVIATERPDEPARWPPNAQTLRVGLEALDLDGRLALVAGELDDDTRCAAEVLDFLGPTTGLPFELVESLTILKAVGALTREKRGWRFNRAKAAEALAGAMADRLAARVADAGPAPHEVARALALFGGAADPADLASCAGVDAEAADAAIRQLEDLGVVRRMGSVARFSHDQIQAAVLAGMDEAARRIGATRIAEGLRRLGARPSTSGRGAAMLNGRLQAGLAEADPADWAQLFLDGAELARSAGAAWGASRWSEAALQLARRGGLVSPRLLREAVYAAVERAEYDEAWALAQEMLAASDTPRARVEADEMRALAKRAAGDLEGALDVAREALGRVGVRVPRRASASELVITALRVLSTDVEKAGRQGRLPPEALEVQTPLMRLLNACGSPLFEQDPMRAVLFAIRGTPRKLVAGTAAGAGTYSVLCAAIGAFRQAGRWAVLSDALQGPGQALRATAMHYSTNFGYAVVRPRQSAGPRIAAMERLAYAEGDLPVAAYANRRRALDVVLSDKRLGEMADVLEGCLTTARRLGDQPTLVTIEALRQFVACLAAEEPRPWRLAGAHFDVTAFEASPLAQAIHAARHIHVLEALLAALHGAWEAGAALHDRTRSSFKAPATQLLPQTWFFATALALYRTGRRPKAWRMAVLRRHARHNPTDHAHRVLLLEAERLQIGGRASEALARYEAAVHAAQSSGCAIEHGLVSAAAGSGARLLGAREAAERFEAERDAVWARLGALALHGRAPAPTSAPAPSPNDEESARAEIDAARANAERASRAKSRLLAEVAHELRTPLQGAVGLLAGSGDAEAIDAVALHGVLRHLATVVDDLADMGALEAGGIALASAPFAPRRTVEQVCAMFAAHAGKRRVVVAGGEGPALLGDEVRLRQIVSNLVSNALKHGAGTVAVEMSIARLDGDAELTIEVSDDGSGLDQADLATIFEPFRRGAGGHAVEGLGLGLPIARRIARAMGGDLRARAQGGRTVFVFHVRLPLAGADAPALAARAPLRVLLAEDVELSRRVLAKLLTAEGCEVVQASDGAEALSKLGAERFDLLLTDQRMPGLSGSELCRRAREQGFTGRIAVATGADDPHLRAELADLSDVSLLRKPVDRDMLRAWLAAGPAAAPSPDVVHGRVRELVDALGSDAEEIFRELPEQLDRLLRDLTVAVEAGSPEEIAAMAHRLCGCAAHFGLAEVAAQSRRLESAALADVRLKRNEARSAMRAIRAAMTKVDWTIYGAVEPPKALTPAN